MKCIHKTSIQKHTLSNSIIASISEARQVRLTRLFAQHDTTDYW